MQCLQDYISHFPNNNLVGQFITHFQIISTSGSQSCLANEGLGMEGALVFVFLQGRRRGELA